MRIFSNTFKIAIILGLLFHGSLMFFTLENTYDALIHVFFGNHYANSWFDPWEPRWYTGFSVMTYPPLVHQLIGLFSYVVGLKMALFVVAGIVNVLFTTGVYRFSLLMLGNKEVAGFTALIAVFVSSFIETFHIFGQIPTLMGISLLMHSFPSIYLFVRTGSKWELAKSISLISITVCSHHVTPLFGMVFFVFPLLGMAVMDESMFQKFGVNDLKLYQESKKITIIEFLQTAIKLLPRLMVYGLMAVLTMVIFILPYWLISKSDPITQVPIPHGSRDNFFEVVSSGFIFFMVPWGFSLLFLWYFFYRFFSKRYIFYGLSFSLLFLLGTGGTTPIPRKMLGENAFNILTLDRFTFWATMISLPFLGEFIYRFFLGDYSQYIKTKYGDILKNILSGFLIFIIILWSITIIALGYFKPFQPQKINILPIVNFLNQDQHYKWRYLTLGFGDQMAWLSSQTYAQMIDGNYHSARRLPELTTRAVERLEGAKFRGVEGIGSLQQMLTNADKYHLKFIFSNDKFYDPMLFFYGWERLTLLENGIWIWQKVSVTPLTDLQYKKEAPTYQKIMWGILPMFAIILAFIFNILLKWVNSVTNMVDVRPKTFLNYNADYSTKPIILWITLGWLFVVLTFWGAYIYTEYYKKMPGSSPENTLLAYYDALDFKKFSKAYSYLSPDSSKTFDQFMLEISMEDGLVNSYGKMNDIKIDVTRRSSTMADAIVTTQWITPLKIYNKKYQEHLEKKGSTWYIVPKKYDPMIQQNVIISKSSTEFYSPGKRVISVDEVNHDDYLQQPMLDIISCNLIKQDSNYFVVGELQNIDDFPASVNITIELYDDKNQLIVVSNAKDIVKHFLQPKEITPFRIDFEELAWLDNTKNIPTTFDPELKTNFKFKKTPTKLIMHCSSNVTFRKIVNDITINNTSMKQNTIEGFSYNTGVEEVTIPQYLVSFYNAENEIIWVDGFYGDRALKPQKKSKFKFVVAPSHIKNAEIIFNGIDRCYLNGIKDVKQSHYENIQSMDVSDNDRIKKMRICINNFVGNIK